ncbi:MAG: topoisomerase DNA-binding C4 zinc finger domain-containing protein [Desulfobacterales bacterium]
MPTNQPCPLCGKELHIKVGKNGPFLACEAIRCQYSRNYVRDEKGDITALEPDHEAAEGEVCDACGRPMVVRQGQFGGFPGVFGISGMQKTRSLVSKNRSAIHRRQMPGKRLRRRTGGAHVQAWQDILRVQPVPQMQFLPPGINPLPENTWLRRGPIMVEKETKRDGKIIKCLDKECGYSESAE